ncbi:preprotein translocase subunit SecE [Candidatus Parcubacteria bacterium]|nr:MAG: preprotein translocase subunit SecE [Candidatus Parcubacteria bacterium]
MWNRFVNYLRDVKIELKKVNWPSRSETLRYTFIVVGISLATALFLGALDFVFIRVLNKFIL